MELPDGSVRKIRRSSDPDSRVPHELSFTCYHRILWASIAYLHNNPVRRGPVGRTTVWPWSSARAYAGDGESAIPLHLDELPRS